MGVNSVTAANDSIVIGGTATDPTVALGLIFPQVAALTDGATIAVNAALGNVFTVTIAGNRTMGSPSNPVNGQDIWFRITQDATGGRTMAWSSAYQFGTGGAPALSAAAGTTDELHFQYDSAQSKWVYLEGVITGGLAVTGPASVTAVEPSGGLASLTVENLNTGFFLHVFDCFAPNLTDNEAAQFHVGKQGSSFNNAEFSYVYHNPGPSIFNMAMQGKGFILSYDDNGKVYTGNVSNVLDDGSGNASVSGNFDVATAGKGLQVKEGSNAKQGTATLSAGTVIVSNTSVTASSRIFLTAQDNNSTGALRVSARTAGTSFTITSSNAGDSGVVAYEIFEPG